METKIVWMIVILAAATLAGLLGELVLVWYRG